MAQRPTERALSGLPLATALSEPHCDPHLLERVHHGVGVDSELIAHTGQRPASRVERGCSFKILHP